MKPLESRSPLYSSLSVVKESVLWLGFKRPSTYVAQESLPGIRNGLFDVSAYPRALELVRNAPKQLGTPSDTWVLFGYFAGLKPKLPILVS